LFLIRACPTLSTKTLGKLIYRVLLGKTGENGKGSSTLAKKLSQASSFFQFGLSTKKTNKPNHP